MDLELLTIGTELLLGFTVETNSAFIGQTLAGAGVRIVRRTSVGDDPEAVRSAVWEALGRTGLVLTVYSFVIYLYRYRALFTDSQR